MARCSNPHCGKEIDPNARFCPYCSGPQLVEGDSGMGPVVFCPKCARELPPGATRCSGCGASLDNAPTDRLVGGQGSTPSQAAPPPASTFGESVPSGGRPAASDPSQPAQGTQAGSGWSPPAVARPAPSMELAYSGSSVPAPYREQEIFYEYRMVQIPPNISVASKQARGSEAAYYLQNIANEHAQQGWEFYRVDTVGVIYKPGCLGAFLGNKNMHVDYYVVTLRRARRQ